MVGGGGGGHELYGGKTGKGERVSKEKEVVLMERDKWKELASSQGWL